MTSAVRRIRRRDARILKRVDAIVLAAIRANPEKYYALMKQKEEAEEQLTATRRRKPDRD